MSGGNSENMELTSKLAGLLGFAAKARKLQHGYNTALLLIKKKEARLVVIAADAAEGTLDKISGKCRSYGIQYKVYGSSEELSKVTGTGDGTVFIITDKGFAEAIIKEIDRIRSEGE